MPRNRTPKPETNPASLPQSPNLWHVAVRRLGFQAPLDDGSMTYPHIIVVADVTEELFLAMEPAETRPETDKVRQVLFGAMLSPGEGNKLPPQRPSRVEFEQEDLSHALKADLWEIGIATSTGEPLPVIDEAVNGLNQVFGGQEAVLPGLLSVTGVTPKIVANLFDAASYFYRLSPWQQISADQPLKVFFDPPGREGFVQVLGQGELEFGLALYWEWEDLIKVYELEAGDFEGIPERGVRSLTYVDRETLPPDDRAALKRYGWKAANRRAFPLPAVFTQEGGERPTREEIIFFEALLRAIPQIVQRHLKLNGASDFAPMDTRIEVQTSDGPMGITFTYPAGELPILWLDEDEFEDDEPAFLEVDLGKQGQEAARLALQAWDAEDPKERQRLAKQAIAAHPGHPLAYILLAEEEDEPAKAIPWFQKAVQAGKNLFTPEFIDEIDDQEQDIWDYVEGRHYLSARRSLGDVLLEAGDEEAALEQYQELLDVDPEDRTGARFQMIFILLRRQEDDQVAEMLEEFVEELQDAEPYLNALIEFRRDGDSRTARQYIRDGLEQNRLFVEYLLGRQPFPIDMPDSPGYTDVEQASYFARLYFPIWYGTPGAIDWLRKVAAK